MTKQSIFALPLAASLVLGAACAACRPGHHRNHRRHRQRCQRRRARCHRHGPRSQQGHDQQLRHGRDRQLHGVLPGAGTYAVEVNVQGFKKSIREGIILQVNQRARIDVTLEVGRIEETTTVVSSAPLVRTDSSEVGTVIEERAIKELPLNGRNFATLVYLTPGITPGQAGENLSGASTFNPRGASNFNALGHQANANAWLIDGIDNNEYSFNTVIISPVGRAGARVQGPDRRVLRRVRPRRRRRLGVDQVRHATRSTARRSSTCATTPSTPGTSSCARPCSPTAASSSIRSRRSTATSTAPPLAVRSSEPDVLLRRLRRSPREARSGVRQHGADRAHADGDFSDFRNPAGNLIPIYDPLTTRLNPAFNSTRPVSATNPQFLRDPYPGQRHPGRPHQRRRPQRRQHLPAAQRPRQLQQLHVHGQPRDDRQRLLGPRRPPVR